MLSFSRATVRQHLNLSVTRCGLLAGLLALPVLCTSAVGQTAPEGLNKIEHIVVCGRPSARC